MQKTPLYDSYAPHGAKVVDFHGWALPVQFSGIVQEHLHTRAKAGLFDCSHMGEFLLRGPEAIAVLERLAFSHLATLPVGRCRYSAVLNVRGGIIDDCVALRLSEEEWYLVTNAGPLETVAALLDHADIDNISAATTKIDLQGPRSREILLEIGLADIAPLKYWTGARATWRGVEMVVTRAGYTGELGYELFVPNDAGPALWEALVSHPEVLPCGLGARDTLRCEVGYPLNGEDLHEDKTPLESGMERFIHWDKEFVGKAALEAQRERPHSVLVAVQSLDRRAPRHGFEVRHEGQVVGQVTSGTFGPSVGTGVGLADVPQALMQPGVPLLAGPRELPLVTAEIPIYKAGTCRS